MVLELWKLLKPLDLSPVTTHQPWIHIGKYFQYILIPHLNNLSEPMSIPSNQMA